MSNEDTLFKRTSAPLPLIAPKHEKDSPPATSFPSKSSCSSRNLALKTPRTRLPPRSRSGCWTCRTRKVKCDEQRPTCQQCSRLGHECDYGPRLSFRDDTPRVIERMQEVSASDSHVWNPSASYPCRDPSPGPEDSLPPFSRLINDEERERKAKLTPPGTYHVIANQRSFSNLPEYAQATCTQDLQEESAPSDPNTVVLERFETFEEPMTRLTSQASRTTINSQSTSTSKSPSTTSTPQDSGSSSFPDLSKLSLLEQAQNGGADSHLLQHYRAEISHHVVQIGRTDTAQDIFEIQARTFPPLFHAMMALSSLNLAHRHGHHVTEALEHYQSTIPAMRAIVKSPQDSFSDGAFFTHFLLLLFEIAAAEHWESNMWQEHIQQLCRIVTLRQQNNGTERHPFLIWMVCLVDTYALLSASGTGCFFETVLEQNIFPTPSECLPPLVPGKPQTFYPEEMSHFPDLLQLNAEVLLTAYQIGLLARNFRVEAQQRQQADPSEVLPEHLYAQQRLERMKELDFGLRSGRSSWIDRFPDYNSWLKIGEWDDSFFLAPRVLAVCEHAYTLFRAALIYLHTSMYPNQVPLPEKLPEIASCASDILLAARRIVGSGRFELRYIVFPLFIAGYATRSEEEKKLSLDLLEQMDKDSFGGNTSEIRKLLRIIHQLQRDTGQVVDWVHEMKQRDLNVVIFGF